MKYMRKPNSDIRSIIEDCTCNMQELVLKEKFRSCIEFISNYTQEFDNRMEAHNVHSLMPHDNVNNIITKDQMVNLYTDKFVKKSQEGRKYYDKLIVSTENGQCPYCGVRHVSTLDHFLTKKKYPSLAVSPINLVPACRDCNSSKNQEIFSCYERTHLNPYYDNIENDIWLETEIIESQDIAFLYKVIKPDHWDNSLYRRVKVHFDLFGLQRLYCLQAADEVTGVKYKLHKIKVQAGIQALQSDLKDTLESCEKIALNGWRQALYRALSKCNWFMESYL